MKPPLLARSTLIAVLLLVGGASAQADEGRVLPFWSRPYPFGYTAGLTQQLDSNEPRRIRVRHRTARIRCWCRHR